MTDKLKEEIKAEFEKAGNAYDITLPPELIRNVLALADQIRKEEQIKLEQVRKGLKEHYEAIILSKDAEIKILDRLVKPKA